jgi:ribosomal protein S12 methylthiotransferase accessory factor
MQRSVCAIQGSQSRCGAKPKQDRGWHKKKPPDRVALPMRWTTGTSFPSGETKAVPRQLIEVPYIYSRGEAILRSPITTGAAAGNSIAECIERGLLEIIERDAFVLAWMTGIRLRRLTKFRRFHADFLALRSLLDHCTAYKIRAELRCIPTTFPVSVIAAFVFDESDCAPKITVGASAAF